MAGASVFYPGKSLYPKRVGGGPAFAPESLINTKGHICDMRRNALLYQDIAGTIPVVNPGDTVRRVDGVKYPSGTLVFDTTSANVIWGGNSLTATAIANHIFLGDNTLNYGSGDGFFSFLSVFRIGLNNSATLVPTYTTSHGAFGEARVSYPTSATNRAIRTSVLSSGTNVDTQLRRDDDTIVTVIANFESGQPVKMFFNGVEFLSVSGAISMPVSWKLIFLPNAGHNLFFNMSTNALITQAQAKDFHIWAMKEFLP